MIPEADGRSPEKRPLGFKWELSTNLKENSIRRTGMERWDGRHKNRIAGT